MANQEQGRDKGDTDPPLAVDPVTLGDDDMVHPRGRTTPAGRSDRDGPSDTGGRKQ